MACINASVIKLAGFVSIVALVAVSVSAQQSSGRQASIVVAPFGVLGEAPAYFTFDVDCLDPAHAPGTGTPEFGGLHPFAPRDQTLGYAELFRTLDDVNPTMGDSMVAETVGFGAFAMSAAPAIMSLIGGTAAQGVEIVAEQAHTDVGAYLVGLWGLPNTIAEAIAWSEGLAGRGPRKPQARTSGPTVGSNAPSVSPENAWQRLTPSDGENHFAPLPVVGT